MPNTNKQLNNIIKQLSRIVGGGSSITHSYASIPLKVNYANNQANRLPYYIAAGGFGGGAGDVGQLYSVTDFQNVDQFTTVNDMSASPDGTGGIELSSANQATYANRMILDTIITDLPKWSISANFLITVGDSNGAIGVGLTSVNSSDKMELAGFINTASTSAPLIITAGLNGSFSDMFSGNNMTVADGNLVRLQLIRDEEIVTLLAYNLTTGVNSSVRATYVPTNQIMPNIGKFSIYLYGGSYVMKSLEIQSDMPKGLTSLVVGDSKMVGYYGFLFPLNVAGQLKVLGYSTDQVAGVSETTADLLNRLQEIIDLEPENVVLAIGCNDIRANVPSATWQANYTNIVNQLQEAGINVIHLLPPKETAINVTPLYTYINNTYSSNKIDAYTAFNTGTMLYGDGIHPNATGMNFIVHQIVTSGILPQ